MPPRLAIEALAKEFARTRSELDATQAQLRCLASAPDAGTYVWPDTSVPAVIVSPPLRRVLGVDPGREAVHPELLFELMHVDDVPGVRATIDERLERGGSFAVDYRLRTRDGRQRRAHTYGEVVRHDDGTASVHGLTSIVDRGREVRLERELRFERDRSARRLTRVMRDGGVSAWDWNLHTGALEVTGVGVVFETDRAGESPGPWRRFVHEDDAAGLGDALEALREPGGSVTFEGRFRPGGDYGYSLLRGRDKRSATGAVVAAGTLVDVDERVRATQKLRRANERLERFSHAVAHDLKAPLRHIDAFASLLEADHGARLDADARALLDSVRRSGRRAFAMVEELLAYAQADGGALDYVSVDLNALVASIREELDGDGERVTWVIDELPAVEADETQARMLFENLISNAVKFSAARPAPRVEVRHERPTAAEAAAGAREVVIVRDNGVGFAQADAAKLFEPFWRSGRTGAQAPGTGIGLSTVADVAAAHGWLIRSSGAAGAGAEFRVLIV